MSRPHASSGSPWVLGTVAFAVVWWAFDLLLLNAGTPDRLDATWEYGVAARTLLAGHGFRTLVIHPPLWTLRDAANTVPLSIHGPLVPLLLAPFLALFGARSLDAIAWLAAAGAVAVVPPLVRLGERCGDAAIGVGAAIVWTLAPLTIHSVHHNAVLPIAAALLVASLERFTLPEPRPLAGSLALGLAGLALPLTHIGAVFASGPSHGVARALAFAPPALTHALLLPTGALGWLAVLGAAFGIAGRSTRRVALLLLGLALVPIVVLAFTRDERSFVAFLPLYALGAARGLQGAATMLPAWARRPRFTIGLLVLVLIPVTGPATREEGVHARGARAVIADERSRLAEWSATLPAADSTVLFSDTPGLVAWTTGRPTLSVLPEELHSLPATATTERPARPDSLHTWFHVPPP